MSHFLIMSVFITAKYYQNINISSIYYFQLSIMCVMIKQYLNKHYIIISQFLKIRLFCIASKIVNKQKVSHSGNMHHAHDHCTGKQSKATIKKIKEAAIKSLENCSCLYVWKPGVLRQAGKTIQVCLCNQTAPGKKKSLTFTWFTGAEQNKVLVLSLVRVFVCA